MKRQALMPKKVPKPVKVHHSLQKESHQLLQAMLMIITMVLVQALLHVQQVIITQVSPQHLRAITRVNLQNIANLNVKMIFKAL